MMDVKVRIYNECKYTLTSKKEAEVEYKGIKGFEVKTMTDEEVCKLGFDCADEYKEYLIITLNDDETATFRNSHVDMFRI